MAKTELRRNRALVPVYAGSEWNWAANDGNLYVRNGSGANEGRRPTTTAAKFLRTATTPNTVILSSFGAGVRDWSVGGRVPCVAGETLTVSTYAKASVDFLAQVSLLYYDVAGAGVGSFVTGSAVPGMANSWARSFVTSVVPATATNVGIGNLSVQTQGGALTTGTEVSWLCDAQYESGGVVTSFFDGTWPDEDRPDLEGTLSYEWAAGVNDSASIEFFEPYTPEPSEYANYSNADLEVAWLRTVSGITGPASLGDLRFAVYGVSEHAYWAARSGLPVGSLVDHKITAMRIDIGVIDGTLADVSRVFWAKNGL